MCIHKNIAQLPPFMWCMDCGALQNDKGQWLIPRINTDHCAERMQLILQRAPAQHCRCDNPRKIVMRLETVQDADEFMHIVNDWRV